MDTEAINLRLAVFLAVVVLGGTLGPVVLFMHRPRDVSWLNMLWLIFWGFWGTMIAAANTALVLTDLAARAARANPDLLLGSVNFESMGLFLTFVIGGSFGLVLLIAQLAWDLGAQIEAEIEASIRRWRLRLDNRRANVRSVDPA